jgi:hypothetical protein
MLTALQITSLTDLVSNIQYETVSAQIEEQLLVMTASMEQRIALKGQGHVYYWQKCDIPAIEGLKRDDFLFL